VITVNLFLQNKWFKLNGLGLHLLKCPSEATIYTQEPRSDVFYAKFQAWTSTVYNIYQNMQNYIVYFTYFVIKTSKSTIKFQNIKIAFLHTVLRITITKCLIPTTFQSWAEQRTRITTVLEIRACSNPSHIFSMPNNDLTWSISNWSTLNAGSHLRQWCHGNTINLILIIFFVQHVKNRWKIIAFNYITLNFRNIYCRYVVLHFGIFDLMYHLTWIAS
jgi:hypothetical protein